MRFVVTFLLLLLGCSLGAAIWHGVLMIRCNCWPGLQVPWWGYVLTPYGLALLAIPLSYRRD